MNSSRVEEWVGNGLQVNVNLSKIPLLAGLQNQTISTLKTLLHFTLIRKGDMVIEADSPGDQLMFLIHGRLQVVDISEDGRQVGLNFLAPGEYFGELSIIDNLPRSASVVACEESLVAALPREHALRLIYHTPLIAERILLRMAANLRSASRYRSILGIHNASQRVFALLNRFSTLAPGGLTVIEKMPTQQEIAIMVNTSRETVSRSIHVLIDRGVVEKDLRRLIVRQPEVLKRAVTQGIDGAS
jgi:CRP-like cAMP-binding protein